MSSATINVSAFRTLLLYQLLSQAQEVSLKDLNQALMSHPLVQQSFTGETINKYLATLRVFGAKTLRYERDGLVYFRLEEHPLRCRCCKEQMHSLRSLMTVLSELPIKTLLTQLCLLLWNVCDKTEQVEIPEVNFLNLFLENHMGRVGQQQLERFQKYCYDGQVLEVRHRGPNLVPVMHLIEPTEVIYHHKKLYLVGIDPKTNRKVRYNIEQIVSHRQLPSRVKTQALSVSVMFKLTDRLAANYRAYPGELVCSKGEFIVVTHKTQDVEPLLNRLMKYGPSCQVLSPDWAREEMRNRIHLLLETLKSTNRVAGEADISTGQTDAILQIWPYYPDILQTLGDVGGG